MRSHLFGLVLRQYIEHKNPSNLRIHVRSNAVLWLSLTTLLSQIPAPVAVPVLGANIGAWWVIASAVYWLSLDAGVSLLVLISTVAFAALPMVPWGPGNNWVIGIVLPITMLVTAGLVALLSHIYHHEHAEYLKTGDKMKDALETTHAVLWGPFHFWLCALLRAGYRPALREEFDIAERRRILRTTARPWSNWAKSVHCRPQTICVPLRVDDLTDIVQDAAREGRKIRMVAGGFNLSSMAASDDILVFCERLNQVEIDSERRTVWVECGTTNRRLNHVLNKAGLQVPWNVVMENVCVGGIVSTGTHGSGKDTATMGDLVLALDVIDANGERRILSEETIGKDAMDAARVGFGMFGVIARVQLRIEPAYRVLQVDRRMKVAEAFEKIPDLVRNRDSVELFWFPYTDWIWVRTFDRTDQAATIRSHGVGFLARNFVEMLFLACGISVVSKRFPSFLPWILRSGATMLGFHKRVISLTDAVHYRRWIELKRTACVEVGFKLDERFSNFRRAFEGTQRLVDEWASKGHYPLDLTVNIRFIGASRALLSPAYGPGLTCYIEALFTQRSREWKVFTSELYSLWLSAHPSALPHWAKEFEHVPGIDLIARERLDGRLTKFRAALQRTGVDPNRMFVNGVVSRVFGI